MSNLSFNLNTQTEQKLIALHNKIHNTYEVIFQLSEDEQASIARFAMISSIGASTRIEQAVLTDTEIQWIDTLFTNSHTSASDTEITIKEKLTQKERSIEEVHIVTGSLSTSMRREHVVGFSERGARWADSYGNAQFSAVAPEASGSTCSE